MRQKKKQIARQKLIEAASVEFAKVGYSRAHMARISTRAGYGKGTVYNYFPSKFDLLIAVVEHAMNMLTEEIRREIAEIADPVEKIKRGLEVDFRFMIENESLSKVIIREGLAAEPQKQVEYEKAIAPISDLVSELMEEGKRDGKFRTDVDSYWATLVLQGIVAYLLLARWTLKEAQSDHRQLADVAIKCFVEGILAE